MIVDGFDPARAPIEMLRDRLSWLNDPIERQEIETEISWRQHWRERGIVGSRFPGKEKR